MRNSLSILGLITLVTSLATAADAQNVVINNASTTGTYGNDTASSLYLRPINNAMLGPSYFGTGYPQMTQTYYQASGPQPQVSGVQAANSYLMNTGWTSWQSQREALMKERSMLLARIEELEKRLAEVEKKVGSK